ncbi:ABC transporter substrate-binding protein [Micromonospora sp. M12]
MQVAINTVDHNTFQENINNYLQGKPDDVFTWFAGYRMRFFAQKGLASDISDVWSKLSGYSDAFKKASTGDDGKQYFVPASYYPWAVFYRKSVWQQHGYQVPTTLDQFTTLSAQMKRDGLTPIAFADKDGWPAMGTFDILNLRINGYQFHIDLMAGKEAWTSDKVKKVFDTWAGLLPCTSRTASAAPGRRPRSRCSRRRAACTCSVSSSASSSATRSRTTSTSSPSRDRPVHRRKGAGRPDRRVHDGPQAQERGQRAQADGVLWRQGRRGHHCQERPTTLVANGSADVSGYTALQKKAAELVGSATEIAQFLDRDTRPDFASTVIIPALQQFIKNPKDIGGLTSSIENQKKSIFTD